MRGSCQTATHFGWLFTTQWNTTYLDLPTWAQGISHIWALPGPKKDEKRANIVIFTIKAIHDQLFNVKMLEQGNNSTEDIQADQFAHLRDPECLKYGPKGAQKVAQISWKKPFGHSNRPEGIFLVGRGGTSFEHNRGPDPVGPFFR